MAYNENYDGIITLIWSIYNEMYRLKDTENTKYLWDNFSGDLVEESHKSEYPLHWYYNLIAAEGSMETDETSSSNAWYMYNFFKTMNEKLGSAQPGPSPTSNKIQEASEVFVYRPITLKLKYNIDDFGIEVRQDSSKRHKKSRCVEMTVNESIADLLSRAGYVVSEVKDFGGMSKPDVKSSDTVSVSKNSQLAEYTQTLSLIQEQRNMIQRKGAVNDYVIGVIQDARGTYLMIYPGESSNSSLTEEIEMISETEGGDIIKWPKAYTGEPVDFNSDDYWKSIVNLVNPMQLSVTYEQELWNKLIQVPSGTNPGEMIGYFIVTMTVK